MGLSLPDDRLRQVMQKLAADPASVQNRSGNTNDSKEHEEPAWHQQ